MKIYNSLKSKKEEFKPIKDKNVSMYVCGITPYDEVHLGHARAYVAFDVIRRHLENRGYKVNYVQNFTDIDDKIINKANEKNITPKQLAESHIKDYFIQMEKLFVNEADHYPKVSENIPNITKFIKKLLDKGSAYEINGDVYFSVRNCRDYCKLSKRNIEELKSGARVNIDENKKDPLDFALWKKAKPEELKTASWDSPWGKGRPGWHIECSVMATDILGETIDIHGGGQDLIFPHHENEIAQTEACTGKPFVNYWIHNGFVTINKEKMSKSLGNFFTLKEIFQKYEPIYVRYFLISQHYRSPIDFSDAALDTAKISLKEIYDAFFRLHQELLKKEEKEEEKTDGMFIKFKKRFLESLDDDFNTEQALSILHELKNYSLNNFLKKDKKWIENSIKLMNTFIKVLLGAEFDFEKAKELKDKQIKDLIKKREVLRKEKKWQEADTIKTELSNKGIKLFDNPDNTTSFSPANINIVRKL
ncbi:cysteine--tRNA ligase [Elusimicrobiota bacterium]